MLTRAIWNGDRRIGDGNCHITGREVARGGRELDRELNIALCCHRVLSDIVVHKKIATFAIRADRPTQTGEVSGAV